MKFPVSQIRIRGVERKFLVIAGDQRHGRAHHHGVILHYAAGYVNQAVGIVQTPLGNPHIIPHGLLGLVYHIHNLVPGGTQDVIGLYLGLTPGALVQEAQLYKGRSLQDNGGQNNQSHTAPGLLFPFGLNEFP